MQIIDKTKEVLETEKVNTKRKFLKLIFAEKDEVPYTYFLLIKELILTLTPAADKKHYLKNSPYFKDLQKLWISALWRDVDRDDFDKIVEATIEAGGI